MGMVMEAGTEVEKGEAEKGEADNNLCSRQGRGYTPRSMNLNTPLPDMNHHLYCTLRSNSAPQDWCTPETNAYMIDDPQLQWGCN